jgi:hypothetical protein
MIAKITAYNPLSFQTANPYKKFRNFFGGARERAENLMNGEEKTVIALE